jgi:protein-arginine kinase activator protein McsA
MKGRCQSCGDVNVNVQKITSKNNQDKYLCDQCKSE